MLFVVLLVLVGVVSYLMQDHDRDMREAESLQELYRMEYHHVYPTSN